MASYIGNSSIFEEKLKEDEIVKSFDEMNLGLELLRGIYGFGFEVPSPIQQKAFIPIIKAQSGTGKTAAISIAVLQKLDLTLKECQAVILVPTKEFAFSIQKQIEYLSCYMYVNCFDSTNDLNDKSELSKLLDSQIVVGTPGRVYDMIKRKMFSTKSIKLFALDALDDFDELLIRRLKDQIHHIFTLIPSNVQLLISLSTNNEPNSLKDLEKTLLRKPCHIIITKQNKTLEGVRQFYVNCDNEDSKLEILSDLYLILESTRASIYCNSKEKTEWLYQKLHAKNFVASPSHSNIDYIKDFEPKPSRTLITTDYSNQNIDFQQIPLVLNFEIPKNFEDYLNRFEIFYKKIRFCERIGISRCYGIRTVAINLITENDVHTMLEIEKFYQTEIKKLPENITDIF